MGRKKIKIQPIKEDRNRSVTYLKRKAGLFKKAHELAVLTDSQVAVIVFGHNGKLAEFCSTDIDLLLLRYTEYDGAAERKGPQHYHGLDKDSDDDEDDADGDDDADGPSKSNQDDLADDSGSGSAGRGGSGGSGGHQRSPSGSSTGRRSGGAKRKADPESPPPSGSRYSKNNSLRHGTFDNVIAPNTAKQAVQNALRHKSYRETTTTDSSQHLSSTASYGFSLMPGGRMLPNRAKHVSSSHQAAVSPIVNPMRASMMANMSIAMPPSADRVPIFVMPATPSMTPGGGVTTPGGRRSSFSDVMLRSHTPVPMTRPMTANALLTPSFLQMQGQYGMPSSFDFMDDSHHAASGHRTSFSDVMANGVTEYDISEGAPLGTDFSHTVDPPQNSAFVSRPASTGVQRGGPIHYDQTMYAHPPVSGQSSIASPIRIVRPYTACGDYASSNTPLHPPTSAYPNHDQSQQNMYRMHLPSSTLSTYGRDAHQDGGERSRGVIQSATPVPSLASSATPDLGNSSDTRSSVTGQSKLPNADKHRHSGSNLSTDDDSPMGNTNFSDHYLDGASDMPDGFQQWFEDQLSVQKASQPATLVQPVPVYAEHQAYNAL